MVTMNKILLASILSIFAVSLAQAGNSVVENEHKSYVFDSEGKCIRTQWMTADDKCADQEIVEEIDMNKVEERVVLFHFDKSNIRPEAEEKLNRLIEILKHNKITNIKLVGYTDKLGSEGYNKKLSQQRAESVKNYLNKRMQLKSSIVELKAMGKTNEFAECDSDLKQSELIECLMPNRRVEVEIDYNFHTKTTVIIPWQKRMHDAEISDPKPE